MAQDLIDKIRAQAQARGLDPEVAVRIAQVESSLDPTAKAKTSSAQGLFQVIDKTWKEHGGKPGQKTNPDENIRVGLNVLESNARSLKSALGRDPSPTELYAAHFLGAQGAKALLSASPDTPVDQLLSARAVKANPTVLQGKKAGDVMAFLDAKMGGSRTTAPATAAAPQAPMPARAAGSPKVAAAAGELGTGYQAALALSFLADEDEDGPLKDENPYDREDRIARESGTTAAQMLAEYKPKNALAGINWDESSLVPVQKMAAGGVPFNPVAMLRPSFKAQLNKAVADSAAYNAAVDEYTKEAEKYNAAVEAYNANPQGEFTLQEPTAPTAPSMDQAQYDALAAKAKKDLQGRSLALQVAANPEQFGLSMNKFFADGGEVKEPSLLGVSGYSEMVARDMYPGQQGQFDQQDAARHMLASGTLARKYGPGTAEFLGKAHEIVTSPARWIGSKLGIAEMPVDYEQDLHNNRLGIELARRSRSQKELEDLVQMEAERAAREQRPGAAWIDRPKRPIKRAEGGEVQEPTPEELAAASRPAFVAQKSGIGRKISTKPGEIEAAVLQGVSEMPYNLVGAPVDVATMVLRPFGYKNEAPVMGSDWIKQQMTRLNVRPEPPTGPTARAAYEAAQLGSSLINPAAPVRGAVAAGQAAGRTARAAMQDFQAYNRELAAPGASYAVKPKGGVFAYTYQGDSRQKTSDLDKLISEYVEEAKHVGNPESQGDLMAFLRAKAPKYFTSTYGTASDPLREAVRTLRIEPFGREASRMPPYMIDAARNPQARGHAQAAVDLERAYDEMTGIRGMAYATPGSEPVSSGVRTRQMLEAMGREGVPVEARNPAFVDVYRTEDFERYPSSSRLMRELVEQQGTLPPHLQQALRTEETIYDVQPRFEMLSPENVIEALNLVPANKLKNMSFPEALIQGMQAAAPLRDYKAAIEIAGRGGAVPPAALMRYTEPVTDTVGGKWVRLTDPLATKMEGKLMNHSVGGYAEGDSYGTAYTGLPYGGKKAFEEGLAQVYSLRDANGKPMVTVEVANKGTKEEPKLVVTQVRGRFNSEPPPRARGAVFDLLDKLDEGGKLKEVRPNSYSVGPTGERLDQGSMVDWGREYDDWKLSTAE